MHFVLSSTISLFALLAGYNVRTLFTPFGESYRMSSLTRRLALKLIGLGSALGLQQKTQAQEKSADTTPEKKADPVVNWSNANDRVFLGGEVWANPMEDWHVADGWAECKTGAGNRSIHSLTHQLTNPTAGFTMSVVIGGRYRPC